jgi:catechol 2,3-dioxygenase-like lactoylglutathione lyase family enzyme
MEEFYPMPAFASLEVADVSASAAWYREALGFRSVYEAPPGPDGQPTLIHLRRERYQDLLLSPAPPGSLQSPGQGVVINFLPGAEPVAAIAEKAKAAGAPQVEGPVERPWNAREITVHDPDGYRIRFSEPIDLTKTFAEVTEQIRDAQ